MYSHVRWIPAKGLRQEEVISANMSLRDVMYPTSHIQPVVKKQECTSSLTSLCGARHVLTLQTNVKAGEGDIQHLGYTASTPAGAQGE